MQHGVRRPHAWSGARADEKVVYGPRRHLHTGDPARRRSPGVDAAEAVREDENAIDRLCRLALRTYDARRIDGAGNAVRAAGRCGLPGTVVDPPTAAAHLPFRDARRSSRERPAISVVMPAFNEAEILATSVKEVVVGLRDRGDPFEPIIVENGSTIARSPSPRASRELSEVRRALRHCEHGRALRRLLGASGEAVVNFDVDYFDLGFLDTAVAKVSRAGLRSSPARRLRAQPIPRAHAEGRVTGRSAPSCALFRLVSDTHGMKACDAPPSRISRRRASVRDLFDTELIVRVERAGLPVGEVPVEVHELRPARSAFLSRVPRTLRGLCKLRMALWREHGGR
jgi:hypothetical protein